MTAPSQAAASCPVCQKPVLPDSAGFLECRCGWGGPGDPVESARGFSRTVTLLDRRWASSIAWGDLKAIAARKGPARGANPLYVLLLVALATFIYLALGALSALVISLLVSYVETGAWVGVVLAGAILFYLYYSLFGLPGRSRALVARLADYPRLEALTREVAAGLKAPAPRWVVVFPGANFFIGQRMLWGKALLPQHVLGIGVAGLALLSEQELRAVLAHELAHRRYAQTLLGEYIRRAGFGLYGIVSAARQGMATQTAPAMRTRIGRNQFGNVGVMLGVILIWVVTLPLRLLWTVFHLLDLRLSHLHEFQADAAAIRLYGTETFISMQTGVLAAGATLRGAGAGLRQEMARHNNPNFFSELRRHYAELPADYHGEMRFKATREYRTLQRTHPTMPDRIRAALIQAVPPSPATPAAPAWQVLTPAGATDPGAIELEMTKRMLG
ncbi:MAG TPA: M48 family metalloprotease [Ktedonobacterales bacterium]